MSAKSKATAPRKESKMEPISILVIVLLVVLIIFVVRRA